MMSLGRFLELSFNVVEKGLVEIKFLEYDLRNRLPVTMSRNSVALSIAGDFHIRYATAGVAGRFAEIPACSENAINSMDELALSGRFRETSCDNVSLPAAYVMFRISPVVSDDFGSRRLTGGILVKGKR